MGKVILHESKRKYSYNNNDTKDLIYKVETLIYKVDRLLKRLG